MYVCVYIYIYIHTHKSIILARIAMHNNTNTSSHYSNDNNNTTNNDNTAAAWSAARGPGRSAESFDFGGFDSSRLLILKGGNSHVHII